MKYYKAILAAICLAHISLIPVKGQDKPLEWKFPTPGAAADLDKGSALNFYNLEQGVKAAFKEIEGTKGAVVILPGPRYDEQERRKIAAGGIDPDRILMAMAVALVLPFPLEAEQAFIAKEDWGAHPVYRWRTRNGAEACASPVPLAPHSEEHDVIFVGPCTLRPKENVLVVTRNGEGAIQGWQSYIPRSLREIIRLHSDPAVLSKIDNGMILTGDLFSSRVRAVYTETTRKIPVARKQHLDMLVTVFHVDPKLIALYDTEMLFKEGKDEHWLPVRHELIPLMEKELNKNEEVILYAEWVGAKKIDGRWEWIFTVNEFQIAVPEVIR